VFNRNTANTSVIFLVVWQKQEWWNLQTTICVAANI
jgi:hypothetical protein